MIRILQPVVAALVVCFALTACSPAREAMNDHKHYLGDPNDPYPLAAAPKVGDILHMPTGVSVTLPQMLDVVSDARVVYVGETHDNPASHQLELQTLKGLAERNEGKVALGMEMFMRSQQPALDRWVAGKLSEKEFLKESRWYDNWRMDFDHYRELLIYARDQKIPVIGLNAEKSLVQAVRSKPLEELSPEEKAQMPEMDMKDPYQRGMVEGIFSGHGSHGQLAIEGFLRVQTLWDETMAESVARYLQSPEGKERKMLVVAGGNHISYGFGIPRRVFRRLPASYAMIGGNEIEIAPEKQGQMMKVELPEFPMVPFHFLVFMSYTELEKQGVKLGVSYEPATDGRGLQVKGVLPGSNAERAGIKQNDLLVALDGEALTDAFDLVYAIGKKKVGDRSTLVIEREGKPMTVEVEYLKESGAHHGKP